MLADADIDKDDAAQTEVIISVTDLNAGYQSNGAAGTSGILVSNGNTSQAQKSTPSASRYHIKAKHYEQKKVGENAKLGEKEFFAGGRRVEACRYTYFEKNRMVFCTVDDSFRLAQLKFNVNRLVEAYPIRWASKFNYDLDRPLVTHPIKKQVHEEICRRADLNGKLYNDTDEIEIIRLRHADLLLRRSFRRDTRIVHVGAFSDLLNRDSTDYNLRERVRLEKLAGSRDKAQNLPFHERWEDWYVVFSDQRMFELCHTDSFASEEVAVVEHPVLGSLREALDDMSSKGTFREPLFFWWKWKTSIVVGYNPLKVNHFTDFYIPKDKTQPDFRYEEIRPFTRDMAHRPTPYIILNVPLLCKIFPGDFYGRGLSNAKTSRLDVVKELLDCPQGPVRNQSNEAKGGDEEGKKLPKEFRAEAPARVYKRYTTGDFVLKDDGKLKHDGYAFQDIFDLSKPLTFRKDQDNGNENQDGLPSRKGLPFRNDQPPDADNEKPGELSQNARPRVTNNLVAMSSLDQWFNPLRPRNGPYTLHQIRFLFRTAYTAFRGVMEAAKRKAIQKMAKKNDELKEMWMPRVIVHTGFWGCGMFGGNPRMMSYIQMLAASAAGVDELHIHHTGEESEREAVEEAGIWYMKDVLGLEDASWVTEDGVVSSRSSDFPKAKDLPNDNIISTSAPSNLAGLTPPSITLDGRDVSAPCPEPTSSEPKPSPFTKGIKTELKTSIPDSEARMGRKLELEELRIPKDGNDRTAPSGESMDDKLEALLRVMEGDTVELELEKLFRGMAERKVTWMREFPKLEYDHPHEGDSEDEAEHESRKAKPDKGGVKCMKEDEDPASAFLDEDCVSAFLHKLYSKVNKLGSTVQRLYRRVEIVMSSLDCTRGDRKKEL
ncbi:hypothetical protein HDU96_008471 [Phlyctochytrium bullatum]|nr:hypothetical protein HDU96_008471 [Phlyctochytrium bullatum]